MSGLSRLILNYIKIYGARFVKKMENGRYSVLTDKQALETIKTRVRQVRREKGH